jgi:hypothetical protein
MHACAARFVTVVFREKYLDLNKAQENDSDSFLGFRESELSHRFQLRARRVFVHFAGKTCSSQPSKSNLFFCMREKKGNLYTLQLTVVLDYYVITYSNGLRFSTPSIFLNHIRPVRRSVSVLQ